MTSRELLAYTQALLAPKPPRIGHEQTHDELMAELDAGRGHE